MQNNIVIQFLREIVIRLTQKSPLFFQILKYISIAVTLVPGIFSLIQASGVVLSPVLSALANHTVIICGIVATFLTSLPVDKQLPTPVAATSKSLENFKATFSPTTEVVEQKAISLPFSDNNKS